MRKEALLIAVCSLAACAAPPGTPAAWEAELRGQTGFTAATGTAIAASAARQTTVTASVTGLTPGATHPWHIHRGTCDNDQGIVGRPGAYPPLQVITGGGAAATARIDVVLEPEQLYFVNVHASPTELDRIVACGPLIRR